MVTGEGYSGGPADVLRQLKLQLLNRDDLEDYSSEFWPDPEAQRGRLFQPEPGCSDTTFVGSAADVSGLSALLLDCVAQTLSSGDAKGIAAAHLLGFPQREPLSAHPYVAFIYNADQVYLDRNHGYQVRISAECMAELTRCVKWNERRRGPLVETGGILYGERDDAAKVIWIDEVTGPPVDSQASEQAFLCGTVGVLERHEALRERTEDTIGFIGMWHTHPKGTADPSDIDYAGIVRMLKPDEISSRRTLLLILGGTATGGPEVGAYVFSGSDVLESIGAPYYLRSRHVYPVRYRIHTVFRGGRSSIERARSAWHSILDSVRKSFG